MLSEAAIRAISFAADERNELLHKHTGTEHLLLGITRTGNSAASLLQRYDLDTERVRKLIYNPDQLTWEGRVPAIDPVVL